MPASLTPQDRARLRVESCCDEVTIRRWARGDRVLPATEARLQRAAQVLGIPLPTRTEPAKEA
jgi:hypothetical protein